jgi:enoyl-CoA hydratase/carnithine racemase
MAFETITLETAGAVAVLTLNRPERMNALSSLLKQELDEALNVIAADQNMRVIVLTGAGEKAFSAGADIKERSNSDPSPAEFVAAQRKTHALFERIAASENPVIAAINGVAMGGGLEIALCCDIRIAADTARLGLPEINLGVIPAGGGTQRLPRLVGAARAKQLIMTGTMLTAAEACSIGLVNEVVPATTLLARARSLANEIAQKPPLAVRSVKRVIDRGLQTELSSALEYELEAAAALYTSEDRKE